VNRAQQVEEIVAFYRTFKPRRRPDKKTREKILERLRDGYSLADLKDAIAGCFSSDWHQGNNDRGRQYNSLELIMRDSKHVDDFMEEWDKEQKRLEYERAEYQRRQQEVSDPPATRPIREQLREYMRER